MTITNVDLKTSLTEPELPGILPVTLDDVKVFGRIDGNDDDASLYDMISAATVFVQRMTRRQLINATYVYYLPWLPTEIELPRPPLASVTSIVYIDADGASQTMATSVYQVDAKSTPGRVKLKFGQSWPVTRDDYNAVAVTYVAGYGVAASSVPHPLRQAIQTLVVHWYDNRDAVLIGAVSKSLEFSLSAQLAMYKVPGGA